MKKFFLILLLILVNSFSVALGNERSSCMSDGGLWREFGSHCADNCDSNFKHKTLCYKKAVFSCDCGKDKCFKDGECITIKDYKKILKDQEDRISYVRDKLNEKKKKYYKEKLASEVTSSSKPRINSKNVKKSAKQNRQNVNSVKSIESEKELCPSGSWREFSNSCANKCLPKVKPVECDYSKTTFGCDCGESSCWNGSACVKTIDYRDNYFNNLNK